MILTPHLLIGAALASKIISWPYAIIAAFLSHFVLDFIPHTEYSILNIKKRQWRKAFPEIGKVALDFLIGLGLAFLILNFKNNLNLNKPLVFAGGIAGVLSDGLSLIGIIFPNKISLYWEEFHKKVHILKNKKISKFWRITSQVVVSVIAVLILLT